MPTAHGDNYGNPARSAARNVTVADFSTYTDAWRASIASSGWDCLFVLPFWLQTVCRHLGARGAPLILTVDDGGETIGHAPLSVDGDCACFLGIPDVCDYQDIVAPAGEAAAVMAAAVAFLKAEGVRRMDLRSLHPRSRALGALKTLALAGDIGLEIVADEVTFETPLPARWEEYLMLLDGKQRHEVRRKIRRLDAHGSYGFHLRTGDCNLTADGDTFLRLFQRNRADKADFMDATMADYFQAQMACLAAEGMLRLGFLEVDGEPAAAVLCFDYRGTRYLYNSGYDARFSDLSVGVLSKIFSIRDGIGAGCRRYDLLKGAEIYKKRIGGRQIDLFRCRVEL